MDAFNLQIILNMSVSCFSFFLQTGEKSGQVEKSKKNARQRQNDFKVCFVVRNMLF